MCVCMCVCVCVCIGPKCVWGWEMCWGVPVLNIDVCECIAIVFISYFVYMCLCDCALMHACVYVYECTFVCLFVCVLLWIGICVCSSLTFIIEKSSGAIVLCKSLPCKRFFK